LTFNSSSFSDLFEHIFENSFHLFSLRVFFTFQPKSIFFCKNYRFFLLKSFLLFNFSITILIFKNRSIEKDRSLFIVLPATAFGRLPFCRSPLNDTGPRIQITSAMFSCIDRLLAKWFYHLGLCIGRYPGYFIIIPFFLSLIFVTGIQRMRYEDDPEYLFSPSDGRSRFERSVIDDHFPMNFSRNFDPGRITHKGRFGRIILTAADNQSVLRPEIFQLAVQFDQVIRDLQIEWDGDSYRYEQLCARTGDHPLTPIPSFDDSGADDEPEVDTLAPVDPSLPSTSAQITTIASLNSTETPNVEASNTTEPDDPIPSDDDSNEATNDDSNSSAQTQYPRRQPRCYVNDVLDLGAYLEHMNSGQIRPTFPTWLNERTLKSYYFPSHLGGVTMDRNSTLRTAQALSLIYFLDVSVKHAHERAQVWEQRFLQAVQDWQQANPQVRVARYVSSTLKDELERNTHSLVSFFSVTVLVMIAFSVATCASSDWVRSKPWLGMLGCISAGLAVAASFGVCMYAGVPMIGINLAAPFLMLGKQSFLFGNIGVCHSD
jgi:hypothetical protein